MIAGVLFSSSPIKPSPSAYSLSSHQRCYGRRGDALKLSSVNSGRSRCLDNVITIRRSKDEEFANIATKLPSSTVLCKAQKVTTSKQPSDEDGDRNDIRRQALQFLLWAAEGVYILWLFLLPYAPVCAWCLLTFPVALMCTFIAYGGSSMGNQFGYSQFSSGPLSQLFFILPLMNYVGIHLIDAPVLHPISEGLFNFVIGWTFMFAPLLFTDCKRDRYKGSLDVLWGLQMFLTNTFLIPYMAIRLNEADAEFAPGKPSQLGSVMTNGATVVGLVGGAVCLVSILWSFFGRMDAGFGNVTERWNFLISYLGSERLAYAFIWDICLYIIFQPWLIGENLQNVEQSKVQKVSKLRFIPVVGLVAYLFSLNTDIEV